MTRCHLQDFGLLVLLSLASEVGMIEAGNKAIASRMGKTDGAVKAKRNVGARILPRVGPYC